MTPENLCETKKGKCTTMISALQFTSSDHALNEGFAWAKEQAMFYVHDSDHVGPWYEAALPGRDAFCIRDVCHQANGAHALGLERHTKNMLLRFVQSISASRDYCCFWEIDKNYRPAPVDYKSDADFWYNLPPTSICSPPASVCTG